MYAITVLHIHSKIPIIPCICWLQPNFLNLYQCIMFQFSNHYVRERERKNQVKTETIKIEKRWEEGSKDDFDLDVR